MGIFSKDKELFKPEYNHQYTIHSSSYKSDNQKEVTLEENITNRCPIDNLQKIWAKNFIIMTLLPVLFIAGVTALEIYTADEYMVLILSVVFFLVYTGFLLQNMRMKDKLVNTYVIRKTKFYEILYKKISEKYTVSAEYSNKINEYTAIFPKKYKLNTAGKEIFGIILFFILFVLFLAVIIIIFDYKTFLYEKHILYAAAVLFIVFLALLIIIYKFFIINPLKRKNEIWYEISLFEKDVTDTFQQIIPNDDKNKKTVNYPVDKTLKQPFAVYFIASIATGFFFIIWDYQMVMAKQKYLSKAYLVEDYFAGLIRNEY